jgi:hypothetical protein
MDRVSVRCGGARHPGRYPGLAGGGVMWYLKNRCECGGKISVITFRGLWVNIMTEIVSHGVCENCLSNKILSSEPLKAYIVNGLLENDEWRITQ